MRRTHAGWLLGVVLAGAGRLEEAREQFEHALRIDPANPQLRSDYEAALGRRIR